MPAPSKLSLRKACEILAAKDRALGRAYELHGVPEWRSGKPTYAALARLVTYQLLSTRAAGAIWGRVQAHLGEVTCSSVRAASEDDLRTCGLSRPKIAHLHSIAAAIEDDRLDLTRICQIDLDDARKQLIAVKGIGPWTAEVFLLYSTGAPDAFPVGDVGLMQAHKMLLESDTRLTAKAFTALAETWRPYRGVAAHLLWGHINAVRASAQKDSPQA